MDGSPANGAIRCAIAPYGLAGSRNEPLSAAIDGLIDRVGEWHGDRHFRDDVTLLGVEMKPLA